MGSNFDAPHPGSIARRAQQQMIRGVVYFVLVFGVGFLLGIVRVLALGA
jgi:hypothetical protein